MQPFTIQCTTCRRSLRVANPEAIGHILSCPKCGSMVLVEPPPGWQLAPSDAVPTVIAPTIQAAGSASDLKASPSAVSIPGSAQTVPSTAAGLESSVAAALDLLSPRSAPAVEKPSPWKNPPTDAAPKNIDMAPAARAVATAKGSDEANTNPAASRPSRAQPTTGEISAVDPWPRWFWPGVATAVIAGALILAVRIILHPIDDDAAAVVATLTVPPTPSNNSAAAAKAEPAGKNPELQQGLPHEVLKPAEEARLPVVAETRPAEQPPQQVQNPIVPHVPALTPLAGFGPEMPTENGPQATSPPAGALVPRTLLRIPPRTVNVVARLADPIPGIESRGLPLADFLALMSQLSTIPITLDADAVLELGQSPAAPVQLRLSNTTVADALETALDPLRLGYQVRDGQLIVGYPPQESMRKVKYTVADLVTGDPQSLADLAALVRRMVAPESWQAAGGKGTMVAENGVLLIEQTEPAHAQVLTFCEKLRVARGLPLKSRFDPSRFVLNTRRDKVHELLHRPITANFLEPQPLSTVVRWLHQSTGANILINHASLSAQELSAESQCMVLAINKPLSVVLDELTGPMELTWRAVDERTVEITTRAAAAARMEVEHYSTAAPAGVISTGQVMIAQIKSTIAPKLWGDSPSNAAIHFDRLSRSLIVRAPQRVQSQFAAAIVGAREKK